MFMFLQGFEPLYAVDSSDHVPYACPEILGQGASCHTTMAQLVVEVVAHPVLSVYLYKEVHEGISKPVVYVVVDEVAIIIG